MFRLERDRPNDSARYLLRPKPKAKTDPRFLERDNPHAKVWDVQPPKSVIDDLREHTKKTGKPDEWKWHCHTPPPHDETPRIIAVGIDIPERLRSEVGLAPCPMCSLHGPRYYEGMLAWWPKEKALRVIGHECGGRFYGDAFTDAKREFKNRIRDDEAINVLFETLPKVREVIAWIHGFKRQARKLDEAQKDFVRGITLKTTTSLYRHIALEGCLRLTEEVWEPVFGKDGSPVTDSNGNEVKKPSLKTVTRLPIAGYETLNKPKKNVELEIYRALVNLESLGDINPSAIEDILIGWGQIKRIAYAVLIKESFAFCRTAYELARTIQAFLTSENLDTICCVVADRRFEIDVHIRRERFGRYELGIGKKSIILINELPEIRNPFLPPPI
jgi:hypothetical protein